MKERLKNLDIKQFILFFVMLGVAAITAALLFAFNDGVKFIYLLGVFATSLIPLLFPLYYVLFGKKLPLFVCAAVCVHIVCAANAGTAMRVYDRVMWWDLFCHGFFGFNAALIVFAVMADCEGIKINPVFVMLIALSVALALGVFWEIAEYLFDRLLGSDAQRVAESVALGKSPLADTMEDLMITVAGVAVFVLFFIADKLSRGRMFVRLNILKPRESAGNNETQGNGIRDI